MNRIKKILNKIYTRYLNLYKTISIDKNSWIDYRSEIESKNNIKMGKNSILYKYITIYKRKEGQFIIGNNSHVAPYGYFLIDKYNITIGDNVAIAKNCSFFCSTNSIPLEQTTLFVNSYQVGDIVMGDNIFIGTNSVILPNTIIENSVVIASNSTVKGLLKSGYLYGGNPVRKIKKVYDV